jgi:TonB-linked SusC/RagA family outer membrane protein
MLQHAGRIMKPTAILILGACLQIHAAAGYGQKITLSEKDVPIEKVFKKIQQQTDYKFLYTSQLLEGAPRVTIAVKNVSVEEVLEVCFKEQPLAYEINENTIVIRPKAKETKSQTTIPGDPIDVSGKVTDGEGRPLPGANVKIKGTSIGTTTNTNGLFSLKGVPENAVLEISFVGHEMKTFIARKTGFFTIALDQKLSMLDETVVIAYGTTSRRFTTGNVATVKAVDIEKQPVQNPLLALQGRVPGVEVTQLTGLPGGGVRIRIQGQNSIRSGLHPLIVIDGVPFPSTLVGNMDQIVQEGSPLNYINPMDIESIDVLKDADATAIYGSRAANGAILITTKKGKIGRATININGQQGWAKVTRSVDMMDTRQYVNMRYDAFRNSGIVWTNPTVIANDLKLWDTTMYTDWQKTLIGGTAKYTNVNIGISGGSSAVQYLLGATYNRQSTVFPGDFDNKAGGLHFSLNGSSVNQKLRLQLSGSYMYNQNHLPGVDLTRQSILMEPNAPDLYNYDGTLNWAPDAAGNSTWSNPLAFTENSEYINTTKNLVANGNISYRLFKGLELRCTGGYTNIISDVYSPTRLEAYAPEIRINSTRASSFGYRNMSSWIVEPQLQYADKFGKGRIEGLIGSTIQKSSFNYLVVTGSGYASDLLMKTLTAASSTTITGSSTGVNRFNALFGRLNYIWDEKYLVNLTARRDGSNKFGDQNKFHNFSSIGLGWIFSQEKWVQRYLSLLSFGKFRASFGTTGNDQIPDFSYLSIYSISNSSVPYQNGIGLNVVNIPNPHLQWEKTEKWQGGLDFGFINNRIILGATYARNRSSNQLIDFVLPSLTGFTSITKNLAAIIQNISWEFTLNTVNIKSRLFNWSSSFNLTIPRNKLVSFPGIELTPYASGNLRTIVGQPLGILKVYQYAGINPANGKYLVVDKNGNPTINVNSASQNVLISPLTQYYGGLINNFRYKGFELDFLIQFVRKMGPRDMFWYNGSNYPGIFNSGSSNQPVTVLNSWQKPGDNSQMPPYFTSTYSSVNAVTSSDAGYNYDASFIRLKNLSLSWQIPDVWLKKAHLQNARLYFQGQNLATISLYSGLDPETMSISTLPPLQLWTMGVTLSF